MRRFEMLLRLTCVGLVLAGCSLADILSFTIPNGATGTITYVNHDPVSATDVSVSTISINGLDLTCFWCTFGFSSGSYIDTAMVGGVLTDSYGAGGPASVWLAGVLQGGYAGTILSGVVESASVSHMGGYDVASGAFHTGVDDAFAQWANLNFAPYVDVPTTPPDYLGTFTLGFVEQDGWITGGSVDAGIPEPASIILLGTLLLAGAGIMRRRMV